MFKTSFAEAGYQEAVKDAMPSPETVESMQQGLKSRIRGLILIYLGVSI